MAESGQFATYIRRSKEEQEDEHQRQDIASWLRERDLNFEDVDVYAEWGGGAEKDRDQFQELVDEIQSGAYTDVVIWEIARIARKGLLSQRFFDACEDAGATIHVTSGSVRKIEPDGHGRMVADVIAAVAAEERRALIRRTEAGLRRAREAGKWLGQVPTGFERVDGYLRPNLSPDRDEDEASYLEVRDALEALDRGESYRSVANDTPGLSRRALMRIDKDPDRRSWYMDDGDVDDDRVAEAVEELDV